MPSRVTIKQLHATTGDYVRRAARSRSPIIVTDRGEAIAVLAHPALLRSRRRKRTLLPEFAALMAGVPGHDLSEDLDAVRGDR